MSDRCLDGAVALVTGASSGVGEATARWLSVHGAAVAVVAGPGPRLERLGADISVTGGCVRVVGADLTDPDRAADVVQAVLDDLGRLDILVNSAGVMLPGTALQARVEDWDRMIALDVAALLHVTHAAVPFLIDAVATSARGVADIVNVTSSVGPGARPGSSVHALTKVGVVGFTDALRTELVHEGVRVGVVGSAASRPLDVAEVVGFVVTRERRVAISELLVRGAEPTW